MTLDDWLRVAVDDAERRGLPDLKPLLEALAKATAALRASEITRLRPDDRLPGVGAAGRRDAC